MAAINDALAGTSGTPSGTNKFVTNSDPRLSGGGSGTVTNIATTAPITGGPITTTGTLGLDLGAGGSLAVSGSKLVRAALTGDVTASADSNATTLAAVGSAATTGDASHVAQVTTDTKGRVTSAAAVAIQIAESQVTNLVTDLAAKAPTTRTITAGTGLTGGGDLSADRTIALSTPVAVANGGTGAATGSANRVFATPDGSAGAPAFRALVSADAVTRVAVTGTTTITATTPIVFVDVTSLAANTTITLSAAITGQLVIISDATGTAASNASGYIIAIARSGSETFSTPGGSAAGLYISEDSGGVILESVTGTGFRVVGGTGWGVDPRTISGLIAWVDARRGVTFASATSRLVSSCADVSGSGLTFAQATAGNQLVLSRMPGGHAALYGNGSQYMSSGNASLSSGAMTALVLHSVQAPVSDGLYHAFYAWGYSTTTGNAFESSMGTTVPDWSQYDLCSFGNGSNSSQTPRFIGYLGTVSGAIPSMRGTGAHVAAARQSSGGVTIQFDGARITQRVATAGAVANVTNQPIWLFSEPSGAAPLIGWIGQFMLFNAAITDANLALLQADLLRQAGRGA